MFFPAAGEPTTVLVNESSATSVGLMVKNDAFLEEFETSSAKHLPFEHF